MKKPRVLIFSGYGLNCEEETKFAFDLAGAQADIVHINELIASPKILNKYQILAFPGGFSFGDDTGSGNAYAQKLKNHLQTNLQEFVTKDHLVIGICNGFQILVNLGLLPAFDHHYSARELGLIHNDSAKYTVRWVDVKVENNTPWLKDIETLSLPIAHGEGKLISDEKILIELNQKSLVALRYMKGEICNYQDLPANPTGSIEDIVAITDESKKILGMMPHPERAIFFTQLPNWTVIKEKLFRENKKLPTAGPGLQIFKNAVAYFNK